MKSSFAFFCYWIHLKTSNLQTTKKMIIVKAVENISALLLNCQNCSSSRFIVLTKGPVKNNDSTFSYLGLTLPVVHVAIHL